MMNLSERKSGDEKAGKSAAELIRERLEQLSGEEFILQIPLDVGTKKEVKHHG